LILMDKSEEYLKQCERAQPYLQLKPQCGDTVTARHPQSNRLIVGIIQHIDQNMVCIQNIDNDYKNQIILPTKALIKLPSQHSLQKMLGKTHTKSGFMTYYGLLKGLHHFVENHKAIQQLQSMEQMWLAFVMEYRHCRMWNGTEWIPSRCPIHNIPITSDGVCPHCQAEHYQEQEALASQADAEAAAQAEAEAREAEERGHAEEMEHQYDGSGDQ